MLLSNVHVGYDISNWDCLVSQFILGVKNKIHIFNLNYTFLYLKNALQFFYRVGLKRGFTAIINENLDFTSELMFFFRRNL